MSKKRNSKYPGLDPKVNLKIRWDAMECDYLDKLDPKAKLLA